LIARLDQLRLLTGRRRLVVERSVGQQIAKRVAATVTTTGDVVERVSCLGFRELFDSRLKPLLRGHGQ